MKKIYGFIVLAAWLFLAWYGMANHEIWRDEMRALSIAIQSPGYLELPGFLLNEGHPVLWYYLLKISYSIFHSTYVLPVLSIIFAAGIAWLLLIRSPFPILISALIVFGTWGLYEFGINCRNYGIAAFLILMFAHLRSKKPESVILQSIILAIAAQANIYAAIMAMLLACWMVFETYTTGGNLKKVLAGFGIIAASFLFVAYVTMPGSDSLVLVNDQQNLKVVFKVWDVGYGFTDLLSQWFPTHNRAVVTVVLWLSVLVFIPKPKVMALLAISLMVMSFFALYYRMNFLQHQGMWIYTYLALVWINYKDIREFLVSKHWLTYLSYAGLLAFTFILVCNFGKGKDAYNYDLIGLRSDSKDAGKWFAANIKPDDIIISEPDYMMESAVYYKYHPYYLPREKRFNTFVHFTRANAEFMSLSRLHEIADSFSATGKTTYLVLGKNFTRDTLYKYSYEKKYVVDSAALVTLNSNYQLMDSFNNNWYCDEHYFIFKRKPILATKAPSH